jgi:hypothetical protein
MKTIIKISILAVLLCIGFIPNSTGASFEPAKTALYLGDDNPGNYSLLQYAVAHGANQQKNSMSQGMHFDARTEHTQGQSFDSIVIHRLMIEGHTYHVPFHLISLFFSQSNSVENKQL